MTTTSHPTPSLYFNRELSWLEFNARVLHEASDERTPLLERLKFLAIYATNLDEFYMVRVAGLRRQVAAGLTLPGPDGIPPADVLAAIHDRVAELEGRREACQREVLAALDARGIRLCRMDELSRPEWLTVDDFFESQVFPVLTPLAVDPGHPFPYISNLSLSLAVRLRDPDRGAEQFARVKVPKSLPRWVPFGRPRHFVPLEEVIGANLGALFPGMEILGWHPFRITRYSDLDLGSIEENQDLLSMIEQQVFRRRFGEVVRLEVAAGMPEPLVQLLADELRDATQENIAPLGPRDVHTCGGLLEAGDLMALAALDVPELHDPPHTPVTARALGDEKRSIFDVIRERDVLVHHPVDSFVTSVEAFLDEAAHDPSVLAIKLTLYRTSGDTAIVRALTEAAQNGKQVAVLVELQARFDEANNITWARTLESHGVHVTYGVPGLKTHCKTALVVRREPDGIRRYCHIGTGNYNSKTARFYTDIGLFTCAPAIGADLSDLFNQLTGYSRQRLFRKLLVAPSNMKARFLELIDRERAHARAGRGGRIVAKMNALVHEELIDALYQASRDGVEVDLIVRGICCLRPGLEGASARIRVRSVLGRFLEHSRVFHFANAGQPEYYIGSADWMPRNLERRVEVVVPVEDPALHPRLQRLLEIYLQDNRQAWLLQPDGSYVQQRPAEGERSRGSHAMLLRDAWGMVRLSGAHAVVDRAAEAAEDRLPPAPPVSAPPAAAPSQGPGPGKKPPRRPAARG